MDLRHTVLGRLAHKLREAATSYPDVSLRVVVHSVAKELDLQARLQERIDGSVTGYSGRAVPGIGNDENQEDDATPATPASRPRPRSAAPAGRSAVSTRRPADHPVPSQCFLILKGHKGAVRSLCQMDTDYLASGSDDGDIRVWNISKQESHCVWRVTHGDKVWCVARYRSSYIVSGSENGTIKIWDFSSKQLMMTLEGHESRVWCVTPLGRASNRIASGSEDRTVRVWDGMHGHCIATLQNGGFVLSITALSTDRFVSTSSTSVCIWSSGPRGFEESSRLEHNGSVTCVAALTPDTDHTSLITGCNMSVRVWNTLTGQCTHNLLGHDSTIFCVSPCPPRGERIVSSSKDLTTRVWDFRRRECISILRGHQAQIFACCGLLPERTGRVASGSGDSTIKVWGEPPKLAGEIEDDNWYY